VKHSWTGGQYSVWRALLAVALAIPLDHAITDWKLRIPAALLGLALALGFFDRLAAFLLALAWWKCQSECSCPATPGIWAVSLLLLLHAVTHGSPYGAIQVRGRVDPAGGWILPAWNFALRQLLVVAAAIGVAVCGRIDIPWALAGVLLLSACDPGWIPPRRSAAPTRVFYDGSCGLCHRFVRFLLAEDRQGTAFRFAPLQGPTFEGAFSADVRASVPDSIVVQDEDGIAQIRSVAVLNALDRLGGGWRAVAVISRIVPRPLRDLVYDGVARVRRTIFAKPPDVCPIVPAHLTRRFDP
jgi:predicted DCC family thiol-disulfide oxidoreductase YuxK